VSGTATRSTNRIWSVGTVSMLSAAREDAGLRQRGYRLVLPFWTWHPE
jgi:hypothetical protein